MATKTSDALAALLADDAHFVGKVTQNEPLFSHTTMRVGGSASLFLEPSDENSLTYALHLVCQNNIPFFILGGGSNLIVSDSGFSGAVISTRKMTGLRKIGGQKLQQVDAGIVEIDAGTPWGTVMTFCRQHDVGGLEAFTGLSGTVGGAVYMNATCFGLAACDRLVRVRYVDSESGEICTYEMTDERRKSDWGYKKSPFQPTGALSARKTCGVLGVQPLGEGVAEDHSVAAGWSEGEAFPRHIILSVQFALLKGFDAEKSEGCIAQRKEKGHFLAPSAGSVFKNDAANGVIAGKVIDECGLKGMQIGGAQVAPWHGNFIVNTGDATAQDIYDLVELIKKIVAEKRGIQLECEIIFLGDFFLH